MEEELKNEEVEEAKNEAEFVEAEEPTELEKAISAAEDYKRKWYSVSAESVIFVTTPVNKNPEIRRSPSDIFPNIGIIINTINSGYPIRLAFI